MERMKWVHARSSGIKKFAIPDNGVYLNATDHLKTQQTMRAQIERIKAKLEQLKQLDKHFSLFGSRKHRYNLNPRLTDKEIRDFETKYEIKLPEGYVLFLTDIGNGGAGPFYGLEPFKNVLFNDLEYRRPESPLNPAKPFLHTAPWNLEFGPTVSEEDNEEEYERQYEEFSEAYADVEQRNGVLAVCNYGCGISLNLVVNGQEYGHLWTDDRGNDNGIYPSCELGNEDKITFLDWYELWLDNSLKEIGGQTQNGG